MRWGPEKKYTFFLSIMNHFDTKSTFNKAKSIHQWINTHIERRLETVYMAMSAVMVSGRWGSEWLLFLAMCFSESFRHDHLSST